ncbi:MAG TPA: FAD binding domain-containing protein [Alphaproteobacteria bacterium]
MGVKANVLPVAEAATPPAAELVGLRTRARIPRFRLHVPATAAEAVALKLRHPLAWYMAGGIDVVNRMKTGVAVDDLIYLAKIPSLKSIAAAEGGIAIGSGATHDEVATSPLVKDGCGGLAAVWARIANPRIRFKGTVGGNIMAAEPGYEAAALLAAADARLRFVGAAGATSLSVDQYLGAGHGLGPETLLDSILILAAPERRFIYDRTLKGIAGVVLSAIVSKGRAHDVRVAVSWAYPRPWTKPIKLSGPIDASGLDASAAELTAAWCADLPPPVSDHLASGAYRRRMIEVKLRRGLQALAKGMST